MSKHKHETFTATELDAMPTISEGHFANLKHDDGKIRYWLSRMTVEDGETSAVYVEKLTDGRWSDVHQYGTPSSSTKRCNTCGDTDEAELHECDCGHVACAEHLRKDRNEDGLTSCEICCSDAEEAAVEAGYSDG